MAAQLEQRLAELQTERERMRDATIRFGEALMATHDPGQLVRVVVESAVESTGATGGVVLGPHGELARAGDPDAGLERISFPLRTGSSDFGQLVLASNSFEAEQVETATSLANQVVVALENARLHRLVERQALVDSLTGLANRRSVEETLRSELARAARFGTEVCVVFADLDFFKLVNDKHGHAAGDEVLKAFALALRETVRESDVAGRWGGEEFAMVLTGTGSIGGARLAERARVAIEARSMEMPNGELVSVTASFGVASYPETHRARRVARRRRFGALRSQACRKEPGRGLTGIERAEDRLNCCVGENMASEQEGFMAVDAPSMFAQVIQDHLELKRRNAALEHEMPLEKYMSDDPFENHPLFKTEEQARIEETMDGVPGIEAEETSLDWPTTEDTFIDEPASSPALEVTEEAAAVAPEGDQPSDENLWSRSRDFDWGD